jgi:NitT/TauT family transport system substrate-binding protein
MKTTRDKSDFEFSRRKFLADTSALGAASFLGLPRPAAAEPPPETTRIRTVRVVSSCFAPQYLAETFLRLEGFSDISYSELTSGNLYDMVDTGEVDMTLEAAPAIVYGLNAASKWVTIAGIHAGCYELFGNDAVRSLRDLKGKSVAVYAMGGADHVLISSMLAYVGMDPKTAVRWVPDDTLGDAMHRFADGEVDAIMGFPPQPQELRAQNVGHVIVDTTTDRPWSQYFCCSLIANREFTARYPIATKRALRAYLKAADVCAREPERAARYLVEKGYESRYAIGLEVLKSVPYNRWREANIEDTIRFYALRLHEVGMITIAPNELVTRAVDQRFLNELKQELKA